MNKKWRTGLVTGAVVLAAAALAVTALWNKRPDTPAPGGTTEPVTPNYTQPVGGEDALAAGGLVIEPQNIHPMGEPVLMRAPDGIDGVYGTVNSAVLTKRAGIFSDVDLHFGDRIQTDEENTLTGNYSYLLMDITLRNDADTEAVIHWQAQVELLTDQVSESGGAEPRVHSFNTNYNSKDHLVITLPPHEERQGTVLYTVADDYLHFENWLLQMDCRGEIRTPRFDYVRIGPSAEGLTRE